MFTNPPLSRLLLLVTLIGLLAAVAIPVFLNQRNKGYDAAKSDVRQIATLQETYAADYARSRGVVVVAAPISHVGIYIGDGRMVHG